MSLLVTGACRQPHHALEGVFCVGSLVQQLTVLQLLTHALQGVEGLVQLHRHGHFGQIFADVVPQDVPQVDVAGVGTWRWEAGTPPVPKGAASKVSIGHWEVKTSLMTQRKQCSNIYSRQGNNLLFKNDLFLKLI